MDRSIKTIRNISGFTIIELVMVLGLMTILLGISVDSYHTWQVKSNVEAQVRMMVSDFSDLRIRALTRKQRHSITVNAKEYVFKAYSSDDEPLSAGAVIPPASRSVGTALKLNATSLYSGQIFEIDHRGMLVSTGGTIYLDTVNSGAAIDCLTVHIVRINPGRKNSNWSNCNDQ